MRCARDGCSKGEDGASNISSMARQQTIHSRVLYTRGNVTVRMQGKVCGIIIRLGLLLQNENQCFLGSLVSPAVASSSVLK